MCGVRTEVDAIPFEGRRLTGKCKVQLETEKRYETITDVLQGREKRRPREGRDGDTSIIPGPTWGPVERAGGGDSVRRQDQTGRMPHQALSGVQARIRGRWWVRRHCAGLSGRGRSSAPFEGLELCADRSCIAVLWAGLWAGSWAGSWWGRGSGGWCQSGRGRADRRGPVAIPATEGEKQVERMDMRGHKKTMVLKER